ncbi:hypothetical protein SteCoe_22100 [Stentor coeruleus]|uniref:Uncharacterized protein n=1 Tax=Stentor coeruleus TaxID=5963 RepID=A0A1R2BN71_9CILI|nr:hypothetical protein SteCoe_22100 [Stentor coeruleus]
MDSQKSRENREKLFFINSFASDWLNIDCSSIEYSELPIKCSTLQAECQKYNLFHINFRKRLQKCQNITYHREIDKSIISYYKDCIELSESYLSSQIDHFYITFKTFEDKLKSL